LAAEEDEEMQLSFALLILRVVLGLTFIGHGSQKLFGWFGGGGMKGTLGMMQRMGARPAGFWAWLAGLSEFGGGLLLALGFLTPLGSLGIIAAMLVAIAQVHWSHGFWNTNRGFEFPLINLTVAFVLGLMGPGAFSVDAIFHTALPEPQALVIGLVVVILGVVAEQASHLRQPTQSADTGRRS
jgi:putative oxidoreductase